MLRTINVRNFRCFKDLNLGNLERFNFIVGDNGSGKSSLLDAVFLCAGTSPEMFLRTLLWRGVISPAKPIELASDSYKTFFEEMFHSFDTSRDIEIKFTDVNSDLRWLVISYGSQGQFSLPLATGDLGSSTAVIQPITFRAGIGEKETYNTQIEIAGGERLRFQAPKAPYSMVLLNASNVFSPDQLSRGLSNLDAQNKKGKILASLTKVFPEINDISVIIHGGAEVPFVGSNLLAKKIPIGSFSAGLTKFLAILVAIENRARGVVLIDEIENGFYHSKIGEYMKAIFEYCESNDTQLFASTHSMEFLRLLTPALKERDDYCLLRMTKKQGQTHVKKVEAENFEAAIEYGFEVR